MTAPEQPRVMVSIPKDLHEALLDEIKGKGFATVDDYVVYVLRVSVGKRDSDEQSGDDSKVTERLKALGYL